MSEPLDFAAQRAAELRSAFERLQERLSTEAGVTPLDEAGLEAFLSQSGDGLLLFTQELEQQPETWDVAVILPEVLKLFAGRLRAGIVPPELARQHKARFGISRWPALVFVRDGGYVGAIEGMRDWQEYIRETAAMLEKPISRAPSVGIPVLAAGAVSSCH